METKFKLLDSPVGDAFAGPAYGEKLKSKGLGQVIGVVAAVAAVSTGVGMVGLAGGLGSAAGLAGGAMVAGGVLSGVGAITGDKKLSKLGTTLTLAGGIGGVATNAFAGNTALNAGKDGLFRGMDAGFSGTSSVEAANKAKIAADAANTAGAINVAPGSNTYLQPGKTGVDAFGFKQVAPATNAVTAGGAGAAGGAGGFGAELAGMKMADKLMLGTLGAQTVGPLLSGQADIDKQKAEAEARLADAQAKMTSLQGDQLALEKMRMANQSSVPLNLDPNAPNYAQLKAQAAATGIPTVDVMNMAEMWQKPRGILNNAAQTGVA